MKRFQIPISLIKFYRYPLIISRFITESKCVVLKGPRYIQASSEFQFGMTLGPLNVGGVERPPVCSK